MSTNQRKRVLLNISGEIFETYEETLTRFPETLLGNKSNLRFYYCSETDQHFFDRNRLCFDAILYFYQSNGTLNCPPGIKIPVFEAECRYFELPDEIINRMKRKEGIIFDLDHNEIINGKPIFKTQIWNLLENPNTSRAAWMFGIFSISMIWVSIIIAFLETMPRFQFDANFVVIELVLNIWFLIEFILRFIFSKSKFEFVQGVMNWLDVFAVIPPFLVLLFQSHADGLFGMFKTLKIMRVMRLFRLSRHSRRLKVVGIILKSSLGNFKLLMLCLIMSIFLGGTIVYYSERYCGHIGFTSIPQGLWWGVQTITSVGYGDLIPTTIFGKTFACCFMLFGALTISLPVVTIVSQFMALYPKNIDCGV